MCDVGLWFSVMNVGLWLYGKCVILLKWWEQADHNRSLGSPFCDMDISGDSWAVVSLRVPHLPGVENYCLCGQVSTFTIEHIYDCISQVPFLWLCFMTGNDFLLPLW